MIDELDVLQNCLTDAGEKLQAALGEFWPAYEYADISTGTQAFFVAQALFQAEFLTYQNVQHAASRAVHVDVLGIHRSHRLVVLVECKQLNSMALSERLGQRWLRLRDQFQLPMGGNRPFGDQYRFFACLTATCWNRKYMEW